MSSILQLIQVGCALPDGRALFANLNHTFSPCRTGLVGANGAGKSLLGRMLAGLTAPTGGAVLRQGRVFHVAQEADPVAYPTVAALAGVAPVLAALQRIAAGSVDEADFAAVGEQWNCAERLHAALDEAGLGHVDAHTPAQQLSGGERQRVALLGAWLADADYLVLDEPSNHLDARQRQLLAEKILCWPRGLLLISHDRILLELVDEVLELSAGGLGVYGGNYSHYVQMRATEQSAFGAAYQAERASARRERREMAAQLERRQRRTARGARQAKDSNQSKLLLDAQKERNENSQGKLRLQQQAALDARRQSVRSAQARCAPPLQRLLLAPEGNVANGKQVLQLTELVLPFGTRQPINFSLSGPGRVAVSGRNGSGKSTLLRVIAGRLRSVAGAVACAAQLGWIDQHAGLQWPDRSALAWLRERNPAMSEAEVRTRLALIGIDAARVGLPTSGLSGGERVKVALAAELYASPPAQLLLLDEPDNHLDLPSLSALEDMLNQYRGAMLVVSHDARFLGNIALDDEIALL